MSAPRRQLSEAQAIAALCSLGWPCLAHRHHRHAPPPSEVSPRSTAPPPRRASAKARRGARQRRPHGNAAAPPQRTGSDSLAPPPRRHRAATELRSSTRRWLSACHRLDSRLNAARDVHRQHPSSWHHARAGCAPAAVNGRRTASSRQPGRRQAALCPPGLTSPLCHDQQGPDSRPSPPLTAAVRAPPPRTVPPDDRRRCPETAPPGHAPTGSTRARTPRRAVTDQIVMRLLPMTMGEKGTVTLSPLGCCHLACVHATTRSHLAPTTPAPPPGQRHRPGASGCAVTHGHRASYPPSPP